MRYFTLFISTTALRGRTSLTYFIATGMMMMLHMVELERKPRVTKLELRLSHPTIIPELFQQSTTTTTIPVAFVSLFGKLIIQYVLLYLFETYSIFKTTLTYA